MNTRLCLMILKSGSMWGKRIKVTGQGRIHFLLGFGSDILQLGLFLFSFMVY